MSRFLHLLECGSRTLRIPDGGSGDAHLGPEDLSRAPWGVLTSGWVENRCLEPPEMVREPPWGCPPLRRVCHSPASPASYPETRLFRRKPRPNLESSANDTETEASVGGGGEACVAPTEAADWNLLTPLPFANCQAFSQSSCSDSSYRDAGGWCPTSHGRRGSLRHFSVLSRGTK